MLASWGVVPGWNEFYMKHGSPDVRCLHVADMSCTYDTPPFTRMGPQGCTTHTTTHSDGWWA